MSSPLLNFLRLKIPPLLLMLVLVGAMGIVDRFLPPVSGVIPYGTEVFILFSMISVYLVLGGVRQFRCAQTTINPVKPETTTSLVIDGVYKTSRNPMYAGFLLFLCGWAMFLGHPLNILLLIGFYQAMNKLQIIPEKIQLEKLFGEEYRAYQQRVRRWL